MAKVRLNPDLIYPVGSIYMSVNDVNPQTLFGGVWERIKDRFLLASGDTYKNGATGGEATHTLTIDEMPSHNHDVVIGVYHSDGEQYLGEGLTTNLGYDYFRRRYHPNCNSKGGSKAHNNMPPYLAVYIWKRTA